MVHINGMGSFQLSVSILICGFCDFGEIFYLCKGLYKVNMSFLNSVGAHKLSADRETGL